MTEENTQDPTLNPPPEPPPLGEQGQRALERMKAENKELRKTLNEMRAQFAGFDPHEYSSLKQEREAAEQRKLEEQGRYNELLAKHEQQLKSQKEETSSWKARYSEKLVRDLLRPVYEEEHGHKGSFDLFYGQVRDRIEIADFDGEKIAVRDKDGNPWTRDDGEPAGLRDLVVSTRENGLGRLFEPINPNQGTGRSPDNGSPSGSTVQRQINRRSDGTIVLKHGDADAVKSGRAVVR